MPSKHPTVRKSPALRRLALLTTVLALPVIFAVLSACSNASDDATPTPIPPPASAPYYGSEVLYISYNDSESIELHMYVGDRLTVSYGSYGAVLLNYSGPPILVPVQLLIVDPLGRRSLQLEEGGSYVEFQAERTGIHQLAFSNTGQLQSSAVVLKYAINPYPLHPVVSPSVARAANAEPGPATPPTKVSRRLLISHGDTARLWVDLKVGDTLSVAYFAAAVPTRNVTAPPPVAIDFEVLDPYFRQSFSMEALSEDSVTVQVEVAGNHQLVFANPYHAEAPLVVVDYTVNP